MTGRPAGRAAHAPAAGYPHDALLFDSTAQLVDLAVPFVREGLAAGEAAVVATSPDTASALRDAVDDPRLHILERGDVYRARTPSAITTFRQLTEERTAEGVRRVRVVGEVDFGESARDWLEWQRYESVVNEALAGWPLWGLCVFDTRRLPEPVLESALHTHSYVVGPGGRAPNPRFVAPADYLRSLPIPAEPLEGARGCGRTRSPTSSASDMPWPPSCRPSTPLTTRSRTTCSPSTR